jgi:hypothetical protein
VRTGKRVKSPKITEQHLVLKLDRILHRVVDNTKTGATVMTVEVIDVMAIGGVEEVEAVDMMTDEVAVEADPAGVTGGDNHETTNNRTLTIRSHN